MAVLDRAADEDCALPAPWPFAELSGASAGLAGDVDSADSAFAVPESSVPEPAEFESAVFDSVEFIDFASISLGALNMDLS